MKLFKFQLILVASILYIPRINIFNLGYASVRLEDLLFTVNFLILISTRNFTKYSFINEKKIYKGVVFITIFSILSAIIAQINQRVSFLTSVLYSFRPIEYFTFFITVLLIAYRNKKSLVNLLIGFTLLNGFVSFLQSVLNLRIGNSRFSFTRESALTGGPYELAMVSVLLIIFWLYNKKYFFSLISFFTLLTSSSRISLIALIAGLLFVFKDKKSRVGDLNDQRKFSGINIASLLIFATIFATFLIYQQNLNLEMSGLFTKYKTRIMNTETGIISLKESKILSANAPRVYNSDQYSSLVYLDPPDFGSKFETSDISSRRRFFVWFVLMREFLAQKVFLFGLAPGFAGSAVDSSFIRILAETGLLGTFSYFIWFRGLFHRSTNWYKGVILAFLITGIYIDIFTSIKSVLIVYILRVIQSAGPPSNQNDRVHE